MVLNTLKNKLKEINRPDKLLARIAVAGPLFILIILTWSYFVVKVSEPLVKTQRSDKSLNPFDGYCTAQIPQPSPQSGASGVTAGGGNVQNPTTCEQGKQLYDCGSLPNIDSSSVCPSNKIFNRGNKWCDDVGLSDGCPGKSGPSAGAPQPSPCDSTNGCSWDSSTNKCINTIEGPLTRKIKQQCCKDHNYESNINWAGLIIYSLVTIPIVYLLIEKIMEVFIFRDRESSADKNKLETKGQYQWLGSVLSNNGSKILLFILFCHFFLLPVFRFIWVSYKCEDVTGGISGEKCNKPCTSDNDCVAFDGHCHMCVNNVCEDPSFTSGDTTTTPANIDISVCSVKSILNDLKPQEIDELYNKFITSPVSPLNDDNKKAAVLTYINTPANDKKVSSYYYKFLPRQEITINDTSTPFRVRLPNPKTGGTHDNAGTSIPGFDYLLNNFIELNTYTHPSTGTNCNSHNSSNICNNDHNCKYVNNRCIQNTCPNSGQRLRLPSITGRDFSQNVTDLNIHNKVIRQGMDHNSSTGYPTNMYPCNDVIIENNIKEVAKSSVRGAPFMNVDEPMNSWINMFELKRTECADKRGQCYMKNYICETEDGVPIPIKNLQHPDPKQFTIGQLTDVGCQKALYPCETVGQPCVTLQMENNYMIEKPNGGKCRNVKWSSNNWVSAQPNDNDRVQMCIPNQPDNSDSSASQYGVTRFPNAKVAPWIAQGGRDVTTECKSVNRMPRSDIGDPPTSTVTPYYRWSSFATAGNNLCRDWTGTCPSPKVKKSIGQYTNNEVTRARQNDHTNNLSANTSHPCCIIASAANEQQNLYVTGTSGTPIAIGGVQPQPVSG